MHDWAYQEGTKKGGLGSFSGLHGMWFSDVFELYDTLTKRSLHSDCPGWLAQHRKAAMHDCNRSFDNLP